jgi:CheY-like chemotaxis protein
LIVEASSKVEEMMGPALNSQASEACDPRLSPLSGRTILLVEDEMMVLMATEDMLFDLGCEAVAAAATVDQALGIIETTVFDAALLDVNLIGERSYPVADALAARGLPFAFATGYGRQGLRDSDQSRPVLMKPYRHEDLADVFVSLFGL